MKIFPVIFTILFFLNAFQAIPIDGYVQRYKRQLGPGQYGPGLGIGRGLGPGGLGLGPGRFGLGRQMGLCPGIGPCLARSI
jgi:hypothetical protein